MNSNHDEWVIHGKRTLDWFIESMGISEWHRRRTNVANYFHSVDAKVNTEKQVQIDGYEKFFDPIAVYSDWISWYMFLVESIFERPGCDDPSQSARIYPFFATIGKNIEAIKKMKGIEIRLKSLFNESQNKPDSTLFEIVVAALYHRNGWIVEFLKEDSSKKTPDLEIVKNDKRLWVECKRFGKVNEYAESERVEWQKRVKHLFNAMRISDTPAFVDIIFKVPLHHTSEIVLGAAFTHYIQSGMMKGGKNLSHKQFDFKAIPLDLKHINELLSHEPTRPTSPLMIKILAGDFDLHSSYTQLIAPRIINTVNPDNKLFILNKFYEGLYAAYIAKWVCIAEESIDKKAKEVKKTLSKALKQIPFSGDGIIHIGYETVTGPMVELRRQMKIKEVMTEFNFGNKNIHGVFFNAFQLLPKVEGFDWAETTLFYEKELDAILVDKLILAPTKTKTRDNTHWDEDLLSQ